MDRETLQQWLDSYGRAWISRDADAAALLYTHDATYQVTPFDQPIAGRAAIHEYWKGVAKTQENIQFACEILAVTPDYGIARWSASFVIVPQNLNTKLNGVFLISLDSAGRCLSLREWWHKQQAPMGSLWPIGCVSISAPSFHPRPLLAQAHSPISC